MQCSSLLVGARIKNTAKAFGALRGRVFSSRDVSERLKGKIYTGGDLSLAQLAQQAHKRDVQGGDVNSNSN